jgi:hypothetical protein
VVNKVVPEKAVVTAHGFISLELAGFSEPVQVVLIETAESPGLGSGKEQGNSFRINMYVRL